MKNLDSNNSLEVLKKITPKLGWCVICSDYEKCLKGYNNFPEEYASNLDCLKLKN